ncbi:MAG: hypothetical protein JHC38_06160, partial [Thiotrichales bacterium]|nr:hypothetical protein [Thiotrichales bacterium]
NKTDNQLLWESSWLIKPLQNAMKTSIVDRQVIADLSAVMDVNEVSLFEYE